MEPRLMRVHDIHNIDTHISCVWCPQKKDQRREDITITQQAGKALDTAASAVPPCFTFYPHLHSLHTQGVWALSNLHENLNSGCDCGPYKCWYFTLSCISLGALKCCGCMKTNIQKRKIHDSYFTKRREVWAILRREPLRCSSLALAVFKQFMTLLQVSPADIDLQLWHPWLVEWNECVHGYTGEPKQTSQQPR